MSRLVYKYTWEIVFRIPKRKIGFAPYSLIRFTKNCDYFNSTIPTYEMIVSLTDEYLDVFRLYDKEISVDVKQIMYSGPDRNNYTDKKIIFEDSFVPFYDKNSIPNYNRANKDVDKNPDKLKTEYSKAISDTPVSMTPYKIRFVLLSKKDLAMRKYIHNYILGSDENPVNPATAVSFIVDQNDNIKKFLMDKPDNTTKYSDMIIKPADIINAIRQIQITYGIYAKDILLFYDSGFLYVLNKYAAEHVHREGEINLITVRINEKTDEPNDENDIIFSEKEKVILYKRVTPIYKSDNESVLGELVGDKFVYSNFDSVINSVFGDEGKTTFVSPLHTIERDIPSHIGTGVKKIIDYDMLNNPYNMTSYVSKTSIGVPISFMLTAVNCDHFSPNKRIRLRLDTPEGEKLYSGTYNIASASFVYNTIQAPHARFDTFGHVSLTLINKTDGYDKNFKVKQED